MGLYYSQLKTTKCFNLHQQRFIHSSQSGKGDTKMNMTQPLTLGLVNLSYLLSINNTIPGHSKEQPKRIHLKWATLSPILEQSKERAN